MLSVATYSQEYIDRCRAQIEADVTAYADLRKAADGGLGSAGAAFESVFFNNMVMALDHYFLHRARTLEGKDGNPLNEVRIVCNSITDNDGVMMADKTIRMKPAGSVLGYDVGDEIKLSEEAFRRLAAGFLAEIAARYR
jgi:hypothetical protein